MQRHRHKTVLVLDTDVTLARILSEISSPVQGVDFNVSVSATEAVELFKGYARLQCVLINVQFGSATYFERAGLKFACYDIRLCTNRKTHPEIILYSFERLASLRAFSEDEFGIDFFSVPGIHFLSLPFLIDDWQRLLRTILSGPTLTSDTFELETAAVRTRLASRIWLDFDHECRNLKQDASGWTRFRDVLVPGLESGLKRIECYEHRFYAEERNELQNMADSETESFSELYELLNGTRTTVSKNLQPSVIALEAKKMTESPTSFLTTILLIEDDPVFMKRVSDCLTGVGHTVVQVTDPKTTSKQILKSVQAEKVKIVLLDLKFGNIEKGFEVLKEIKERAAQTKVIMITGYGGENIIRAKEYGADDFIRKPVSEDLLLDKLKEALAERRILLIDDHIDELLPSGVLQAFESKRCKVYSYAEPDHAVDDIENGRIPLKTLSLVLLDLKFGESFEKGFEAFKKLKDLRNDLSIFVLTGYGTDEVRQQVAFGTLKDYFKPPQDDFLSKPLSDEGWNRIWRLLFPRPERLLLMGKSSSIAVFEPGGALLGEIRYPPKQWFLLYWLAIKREKGLSGIDIKSFDEDDELREARLDLRQEVEWDDQALRENITHINKSAKKIPGLEKGLVNLSARWTYALSPLITRIEKTP